MAPKPEPTAPSQPSVVPREPTASQPSVVGRELTVPSQPSVTAQPRTAEPTGATALPAASRQATPSRIDAAASRQPTVVLDPGHGGSNPGAQGVTGLREKQLTLTLSNLVATRLRERGIAVTLTRDTDRTLTLRQRVEIANRLPADIFVSIHGNASNTRAQTGFETFVLTAQGVDIDARALRSGATTPRPGVDPDIALVLDDVERGASQWESAELAARMQKALRERRGSAGDRGVRQAVHHVLLGATMPAVLVEVGFIDHPVEGRQLVDANVQGQLADAIAEAIEDQLAD